MYENKMGGDGIRVTQQCAKTMDEFEPTHNNEIMRRNRMGARWNHSYADDFRG